jgi:hypothetical protein
MSMDILAIYIDLKLDLNLLCVYEWFLCVYGYEIWLIVFVLMICGLL